MTQRDTLAMGLHPVPPGHLATVVTHLDMMSSPAPRARPDGMALVHLPDLSLTAYRALFRAVGSPWLWTSRLRVEDAALAAILRDPAVRVMAIVQDDTDVGLVELDFRCPDRCELAFFGLIPGREGKGIGRWAMTEAVALALASRPLLTVHTCTLDSPVALPFYLSCGFRAVRREVDVFPDPRCDGVLPTDSAPQMPLL